jgi:hypothetical protein
MIDVQETLQRGLKMDEGNHSDSTGMGMGAEKMGASMVDGIMDNGMGMGMGRNEGKLKFNESIELQIKLIL